MTDPDFDQTVFPDQKPLEVKVLTADYEDRIKMLRAKIQDQDEIIGHLKAKVIGHENVIEMYQKNGGRMLHIINEITEDLKKIEDLQPINEHLRREYSRNAIQRIKEGLSGSA